MGLLKNKNGFSTILVCVIVLFAAMLLAAGVQYRAVFSVVEMQREETQRTLDSLVMKAAVDNYDALKQGDAYGRYLDRDSLTVAAYAALGFPAGKTQREGDGYTMKRPRIEAVEENGFGVTAAYELTVPFELFGRTAAEIVVPVEIVSRFTEK